MLKYNGIHDIANIITFRSDLHFSFDQNRFIIVPKLLGGGSGLYALSIHVLKDGKDELVPLYHNLPIQPGAAPEISRESLFARLALSIFPLVQSFLNAESPRYLAVMSPESSGPTPKFSWMNKQQLTSFRSQRGETPTGPRKRLSSQISRDDEIGYEAICESQQYQERRRYSVDSERILDDGLLDWFSDDEDPDECTRWYYEHGRVTKTPTSHASVSYGLLDTLPICYLCPSPLGTPCGFQDQLLVLGNTGDGRTV